MTTIVSALLTTDRRKHPFTRRGEDELHIHVEAASPAHAAQSALISACLRHASFSRCPEGSPRIFTCRADSEKHRQTANTMLRHGATEHPPRHFLKKLLYQRLYPQKTPAREDHAHG